MRGRSVAGGASSCSSGSIAVTALHPEAYGGSGAPPERLGRAAVISLARPRGRRAGETGRRTAASEGRPWAYASPPGGTRARRRRRSSSGSRCTAKSQVPSRSRRWYSWMSALR